MSMLSTDYINSAKLKIKILSSAEHCNEHMKHLRFLFTILFWPFLCHDQYTSHWLCVTSRCFVQKLTSFALCCYVFVNRHHAINKTTCNFIKLHLNTLLFNKSLVGEQLAWTLAHFPSDKRKLLAGEENVLVPDERIGFSQALIWDSNGIFSISSVVKTFDDFFDIMFDP